MCDDHIIFSDTSLLYVLMRFGLGILDEYGKIVPDEEDLFVMEKMALEEISVIKRAVGDHRGRDDYRFMEEKEFE